MKQLNKFIFVFALLLAFLGLTATDVFAADTPINQVSINCADTNSCSTNPDFYATLKLVINTLSGFIGIAAVIVIIISGFTFATSGGDAKAIETAKNRIVYSILGIIVVLIAASIVNFVLKSV